MIIHSYAEFWKHEITEDNLAKMLRFGLMLPEAAWHRWNLLGGPCPWFPDESEENNLKLDPRYSAWDSFGGLKYPMGEE